MHSLSEFGSNVPAFLAKLWKLVDDPETNELISWTEEGTSFYIKDQAQFSRKLLPMYYKHNNMASFIRQLNMYGFHKIVSADAGSLRLDKDEMEFAHQCFLRGHPYLLEHIKRKVGKSQMLTSKQIEEGVEGSNGGVVVKAEFMNKILTEVKHMRGRQETVEGRLSAMKQENEALWRELSLLRQKHIKQQTIVNKLIQFLVTLVQPSQRLSKRRYPLMINSVAHPSDKVNGKISKLNPNDQQRPLCLSFRASQNLLSPSGPTIHELDGDAILPDTDADLLSNTITLHVPDSGLTEVIDSNLEPDSEVLDGLNSSIIQGTHTTTPSSLPSMEVNSCEQELLIGDTLKTSSPSPELLLAVAPSELNPAIIVPGLQESKAKMSSLVTGLPSTPKVVTRSSSAAGTAPTRSIVTRRSAANGAKSMPPTSKISAASYKGGNDLNMKIERAEIEPTLKRELRVLPPRNRKKKSSKEASLLTEGVSVENRTMKPVDLLAEVDLAEIPSSDSTTPMTHNGGILNGSAAGIISPPAPSQLVTFPLPESPNPIVHSPVASPSSASPHCNMTQSMAPLSNTIITDVTSPLMVYPSPSASTDQLSPQVSPNGGLSSSYDMTLACTSQAGSSPTNSTATKSSPFARCDINPQDDLDIHVGSMDSELGQLKELLNNSGIQLDANTLLGLFSSDDSMHMPEGNMTDFSPKMDPTGNELMYYQPDFLDLEEIWNSDNNKSTPPQSPVDMLSEVNTPVMMPSSPGFSGPSAKRRRI